MILSETLKEKRIEKQLTQEQLSEKIYVSRKTISNWETGKTTPDIDSLILLVSLFDLSLDHLLLEGSDIVKSIKNQAELKNTKIFLVITSITNIVFFFLATSQSYFGQLPLLINIAILIGTFTNLSAMFYFITKISNLESRPQSESKKAVFLVVSFFILIILITLSIYFLSSE